MKKIITLLAVLCFFTHVNAQIRVCVATQHEQWLQQQNPKRAEQRKAYEELLTAFIKNAATHKTTQTQNIIQIPLVVHMVYHSASDSVSVAQILSQIKILNNDYTRQNADTVNTPAAFKSVAAAPMIKFCLAQRDPNGNATTGIEYKKSTTVSWSSNDAVKSASTGGLNAWDPTRYFNIWVCDMQLSGLLAYAEYPTSTVSNNYGCVVTYNCFGDTLKAVAPYNKGRVATHEIAKCFNLIDIWGTKSSPSCTDSDLCTDTPNQAGLTGGCPTFPVTDSCTTTAPGIMFMNFMDATNDTCMNMFTADQSLRMLAVLNTAPYNSLTTSNGCTPLASISTQNATQGVSIYPNPSADGKFIVDIKKDEHAVQHLSVYDVLGNKVFEIKNNMAAGTYDINLSNLSSGTYLVEIIKDNTALFNKIIINK
jgi:hypothetical protein